MILGVIDSIWEFFLKLTTNGFTNDLLFYISIGFTVVMVVFFMLKNRFAYEGRLERSLEKINRWLYSHQQIDETNLVEFNNLIKSSPRLLRYHWQQYMLYREHEPSHYMSMYNCIEKPLHTSSAKANVKNFTLICVTTMIVTFLLSLINYGKTALTVESIAIPLIAPAIVMILGTIFIMFLRAMQNFTLSSLYQNFHLFNRYIDKASTTIPKYVDFEILFTRKEIKGGIPVLNEYLEKRARQEAEELEKARRETVELEAYNFKETGIDGSLILDRAMKESEIYLNSRTRLLTQIQQFESEIESLKRNYENTSKEYQRKLQASKENIERLRTQQEESTNRIEVNYLRKQQQDEIKKQEQLEKDQDSATLRFDQETSVLKDQIEKARMELEQKKDYATNSMLSEYDTFATKIYKAIMNDVQQKHQEELNSMAEQNDNLQKELEKAQEINNIKESVINDLKDLIREGYDEDESYDETEEELTEEESTEEEPTVEEASDFEQETETVAEEATESEEEVETSEEPVAEETVAEETVEEETATEETVEPETEEPAEVAEETATEETEDFYDEEGYYWFANGTYYDPNGYYHAEDGNVYTQEGEYVSPEEYQEKTGLTLEEAVRTKPERPVETAEPETEETAEVAEETADTEETEETTETVETEEDVEGEEVEEESEDETEEDVVEEEQSTTRHRGRPRKVVSEEEANKPKGKRGRPRKVVSEEEVNKPKGHRGRPRKEVAEVVEDKPKGQRGRPRKVVSETTETKPKGQRGRPRKVVSEEEANKPKGHRGRPRKVVSEEEANKPKGKRGRPRKS